MKKHIPNILSVARFFFSLGTLIMTWKEAWPYCFLFLALGIISDLLDGYLARRWKVESDLGQSLDNKADLALSGSVVIGFWLNGAISFLTILIMGVVGFITIVPYLLPSKKPAVYKELGDALTGFYFVGTLAFFAGLFTYKIFGYSYALFSLEALIILIGTLVRRKKINYWLTGLKFWRKET